MAIVHETGGPHETSGPAMADPMPHVRRVAIDAPWDWVAAGWQDLKRSSTASLIYGLAFALISGSLVITLTALDLSALVVALAAGFILVGPILAVGLYEASRRLEKGLSVNLLDIVLVRITSPSQLFFLGSLLMIGFLIWVRIAMLLFALFYGLHEIPPLTAFVGELLFTVRGLILLCAGSFIGTLLAMTVFSISAISVPLLMVRNMDAVSAMLISIEAVRKNFLPMLVWAWLIALLMFVGFATLFVGLIFTFPLIGHATWHAFRAVIDTETLA